jgi:glutamate racemase
MEKYNMNYVGIFDSGVGGLGIFEEINNLLPKENILYLADTANCPYGEKPIEKIQEICKHNVNFLIKHGAKIIVVACNSASVSALTYLRQEFPNIPIIGVVPVVKTAAKITKNKKIGILATKRTVESAYLKNLVNEFCPPSSGFKIYYQAANPLVELVESRNFGICSGSAFDSSRPSHPISSLRSVNRHFAESRSFEIIKEHLKPFIKAKVDVVALGCTHFPFLKKEIEEILTPNIKVLDSNGAVARQVVRVLSNNKQLNSKNVNSAYKFYTSGDVDKMQKQVNDLIDFSKKDCFYSCN